ncbi:hypothetical protein SB394_09195 [Burkholderia sp. BCCIQ04A]|uniref:Uncharacterized protein n=1 Tax=Burkholderia anthinoferrum TaxID=3090833 RepID=A0ABU5WX67_9BURK|nr:MULTISPECIES: hypothetical protein [Burkholderia]MEB2506947.1 hypothetical protein [Burkholderia anthinoferrum]MEB2536029.1 hypothetical protein [Burkholderia anthinoferrum]MEB2564911.1 hypothetical protein [Burkholderia anthinoferrum]MEB2583380.1 hypothetical protein [Burkholderia anthinoferrum]MCA8105311.1 hypothetical protein [Burkholderia sp. AU36459]
MAKATFAQRSVFPRRPVTSVDTASTVGAPGHANRRATTLEIRASRPILVSLKQPRLTRCVFRFVCQRDRSRIDELERVVRFVLRAGSNRERIMNDPFFIFDRLPGVGRRPRRAARVVTGLPAGLRIARNGTGRFAPTGARIRLTRKPFVLRGAGQPAAIGRPKPPRRRVAAPGRLLHPVSFFRVTLAGGGSALDGGRPC